MGIEEIKSKYDKAIYRENKAEVYLKHDPENNNINKWLTSFEELTKELSITIDEYEKASGKSITQSEAQYGFNSFNVFVCKLISNMSGNISLVKDTKDFEKVKKLLDFIETLEK